MRPPVRSQAFVSSVVLVALVTGCGTSTPSIASSGPSASVVVAASPSTQPNPPTPVVSESAASGQILFTRTYDGDQQAIFGLWFRPTAVERSVAQPRTAGLVTGWHADRVRGLG